MRQVEKGDWLAWDAAAPAQMAERARLIAEHPGAVMWSEDGSEDALGELLDTVIEAALATGRWQQQGERIRRPDGVRVALDDADPLATLGRTFAEDFVLLQERDGGYRLTAAVLCFPAGWRLDEKAGLALAGIHAPVDVYDDGIARRVDRLFDGLRPGRPIWRANALAYDDPALFQPEKSDGNGHEGRGRFLRCERQCLMRLPRTKAVVFSIHTMLALWPGGDARIAP